MRWYRHIVSISGVAVMFLTCCVLAAGLSGLAHAKDPPPVSLGMSGEAVLQLQKALSQLRDVTGRPLYDGKMTGVFDAATQTAVRYFQRNVYLPMTGEVDAFTWRNLREALVGRPLIIGYYGSGGVYDSLPVLRERGNLMTAIAPAWFWVERDGRVLGEIDAAAMHAARVQGVRLLALVSNLRYDTATSKEQVRAILNDPGLMKTLIGNIILLVERFGFDGINLDFEYVAPADRDKFSLFASMLGDQLRTRRRWFTISVAAKTADRDFAHSFNGGFDYRALGRVADHLMLMAYDRHYAGGPPGPVAPLDWVHQVLTYAGSRVHPARLVLGVNAYGYDWHSPGVRARAVVMRNVGAWAAAREAQLFWDPVAHVPYARYSDAGGVERQAWLENSKSIGSKMDLVRYHGIAGLAWWRMGYEDESFWQVLEARWPYPTKWSS